MRLDQLLIVFYCIFKIGYIIICLGADENNLVERGKLKQEARASAEIEEGLKTLKICREGRCSVVM